MSYHIMSNTPFVKMSNEIYDQLEPGLSWLVEYVTSLDNAQDKALQRINALEGQFATLTMRLNGLEAAHMSPEENIPAVFERIADALARIADVLEAQDSRDSLAESVAIWGTGE